MYFSGNVSATSEGWVTINLNRPFYYDNESGNHMMLAIYDHTGNYESAQPAFKVRNFSNSRGVRYWSGASSGGLDVSSPSTSCEGSDTNEFVPALMINYKAIAPASMPYFCDFEDDTERGKWMLKNTTDNMNAGWYMWGNSVNHSLLCGDGQGNANYQTSGQSVTVLAERNITLSQADQIAISFDLNVGGEHSSDYTYSYDYVMAFLAPCNEGWDPSASTTTYTGYSYEWDLPYALHFGSQDVPGTKLTFKNGERMGVVIDNPGKGHLYKLVFVWRNDNSSGDGIAATIDNVAVEDYVIYDIKVGNTVVNSLNRFNITDNDLVAGRISFNPSTKTLTMNGATLDTYDGISINKNYGDLPIENPVIELIGENDVLGYINLVDNVSFEHTGLLKITGSGSLAADYLGVSSNVNILVKDCELNLNTTEDWGLYGFGDNNVLTFNNAKAHIKSSTYAVGDFSEINLVGCEITLPVNALIASTDGYSSIFVCNSNGTAATEVIINRADGIAQNETETINVYPNPATNMLFIEGADGETVRVYDNTGRVVIETIYSGSLDVSQLAQGVYAATVSGRTVKFVKE